LHELVNIVPANAASSGTSDVSVMPGWGWPQRRRGLFPRCGRRSGNPRDSSRPGSQAPHAPPAL